MLMYGVLIIFLCFPSLGNTINTTVNVLGDGMGTCVVEHCHVTTLSVEQRMQRQQISPVNRKMLIRY